MRQFLSLLALLFFSLTAFSQKTSKDHYILHGVLQDSLTHIGEEYATVSVARDSVGAQPLRMMVTGKNGSFKMSVPGKGRFVVSFSSLGKKTVYHRFSVASGVDDVDLGTLYLHEGKGVELNEVEVVSHRPLVKADIDKISYNIEDDPDSKTNTVMEMLRKVPLVTVDGEDNIKVNNNSSFKVYVNGKPNNLMSNNPKEVLKSMPANSIKRIEVITNPGPKYDAEGVGGILNIITVGQGLEGYTVTLNGNVGNRDAGTGFFGTIKKGKLTVSARYNYSYYNSPTTSSGGNRKMVGEISDDASNLNYSSESKGHGQGHNGSLEASYEIDTLRLVTLSLGLWGSSGKNSSWNDVHAVAPLTLSPLYNYFSSGRSNSSWFSIDGSIDYQRLFQVKERMLTFSYKVNTNPNTSNSYTDYNKMEAVDDWLEFLKRMKAQHMDGWANTIENTFQVDYSTPIAKIHTLETGLKFILRNNLSNNDRYIREAMKASDYTPDAANSSHYRHSNAIMAGYVGYGLKVNQVSGRLGIRYEHTIQDVKYKLGRGDNFRKNFDDVVPSASIGYRLSDVSNFSLGYNLRIYRPGIWYLNPYINDSDPTSISQGNPNLNSEKSHSLNLSYNSFSSKFSMNLSVNYGFTNNSIESTTQDINDKLITGLEHPTGKNVLFATYKNIGKNRNFGLNGYLNWNPFTRTRFYTNFYTGYVYVSDGVNLQNKGWNAFVYCNVQQSFEHDWNVSIYGWKQTPWVMLQGKSGGYMDYSVSLGKSWLKKRLTVNIFASNFFNKTINYKTTLESANFVQNSWSHNNVLRYGLSISFRLGELTASVKKTERSISNDDVKSGGNSGGK